MGRRSLAPGGAPCGEALRRTVAITATIRRPDAARISRRAARARASRSRADLERRSRQWRSRTPRRSRRSRARSCFDHLFDAAMSHRLLGGDPFKRAFDGLVRGQVEEAEGEQLSLVGEIARQERPATVEAEPLVGVPGVDEVPVALTGPQTPDQYGHEHDAGFGTSSHRPARASALGRHSASARRWSAGSATGAPASDPR
jgi:hypothetical protein